MASPEFHDKIDAFDLVITALKDHEKRLDTLSERLESLVSTLGRVSLPVKKPSSESQYSQGHLTVVCAQWNEFRESCQNAAIITFEIEDSVFHIYAKVDDVMFCYFEPLPKKKLTVMENKSSFSISKSQLSHIELLQFLVDGKLKCGITLLIHNAMKKIPEDQYLFDLRYEVDAEKVKNFLAEELDVPTNKIIEGKITSKK
jgi:hypothetical protein